ncbi:MAG: hypothetical protein SangKO_070580 [Sandaracinaceae bacterium]|nr:Flp pilus assembly protein CpaB [Myxococcales bacterium]
MNRTLLIASGALIFAGMAVFYVYAQTYIQDETGGTRVRVVSAAVDIPFGEPIQPGWLTVKEIPQSYVEDRHLGQSELRQLIGQRLAQSVRYGEAILRTDLSTFSDQQRTLSGEIPQGKRAITLDVVRESSHGGLLRPGDRVDAIVTVGDRRVPNSGRSVVVAQNLLVLSVGRLVTWTYDDEDESQTRRQSGRSPVSLEVDLEDAQRLTLAGREGALCLVLRHGNDVSMLDRPPEVREENLFDRARRADWARRFALVERPDPPTEATQ